MSPKLLLLWPDEGHHAMADSFDVGGEVSEVEFAGIVEISDSHEVANGDGIDICP